MKVTVTRTYQSFDGKRFDSREACEQYEGHNFLKQFVGLKLPKIEGTLNPASPDERALADAVELWAARISANRLKRGERKRTARQRGDESAPNSPVPPLAAE